MSSAISFPTSSLAAVSSTNSASASGLSPEERVLALVVLTQTTQMHSAETSVQLNSDQLEELRAQVKKALDEARAAKKDAGFWGGLAKLFGSDLASVASAVAAVAAVIGSGGAAIAIVAAVAAAVTIATDHAKELGIPPDVAMAIGVTVGVASLCCGGAGGVLKLSEAASKVRTWANVAEGALHAAGGGLSMVAAKHERDAGMYGATARAGQGQQELVSGDIDEALDRLAAAFQYQDAAIQTTSEIQQQSAASRFATLNNWVGAA
jgi:hypothetical protein